MTSRSRQDGGDDGRRDYDRHNMRDGYSGPDSRFRDRDGREHYNDGRFAPMNRGGDYGGDPMDRGGDGYPRSAYMEPYSHYPITPYVPPVYRREDWQSRKGHRPMNKIGFSVDGEMEPLPQELGHDYPMSAGYKGREEMSRRQGSGYDMGQGPKVMPVFNRQMAEEWVSQMQNSDGTRGPHFSTEKAKEVMKQYNVDCDPLEFYVVLNSLYSDYDQALKKNNASNLELYACLAKAWIEDKDAVPNKAAAYYTYVVQR
jgi:hypothetical protein